MRATTTGVLGWTIGAGIEAKFADIGWCESSIYSSTATKRRSSATYRPKNGVAYHF